MDWQLVIIRNRDALLRIVTALLVMAGLTGGARIATLPRHRRNHVLRILRPAESAIRRLIVIAAREVVVTGARQQRAESEAHKGGTENTKAKRQKSQERGNSFHSLPLLDPLKSFDVGKKYSRTFPRISFIGVTDPCPLPPVRSPDDPVSAERLGRRLQALKRALDDLPGQAIRLARWQIRKQQNRTQRTSVFRPGWPPGYRKRPVHPVDDILRECHSLAHLAIKPPEP